jgi:hypothetical protein
MNEIKVENQDKSFEVSRATIVWEAVKEKNDPKQQNNEAENWNEISVREKFTQAAVAFRKSSSAWSEMFSEEWIETPAMWFVSAASSSRWHSQENIR